MKLVHKSLEKDGAGSIVMVPEETEDMWHVFNLIAEGDSVRASTVRKVTTESNTGTRYTSTPLRPRCDPAHMTSTLNLSTPTMVKADVLMYTFNFKIFL